MLELVDLSKRYGDLTALAPLSMEVAAGAITVLIGPSGCGKSTLLRLVLGLITADSGQVLFEGETLSSDNLPRLRRRMGYVVQDGGLFPHLTAAGNLTLLPRQVGWSAERIARRVAELAELTRFPADGLQRFPVELSGGQRQRVSLMRALMLDPELLLLDEPLGALDPMIRADLQSELREIFRRLGKTVLLVTHDIGEAGYFADEIVLMRDGRVVQRGTLEDLVYRPAERFVESFVNAQRSPLERLREDGES